MRLFYFQIIVYHFSNLVISLRLFLQFLSFLINVLSIILQQLFSRTVRDLFVAKAAFNCHRRVLHLLHPSERLTAGPSSSTGRSVNVTALNRRVAESPSHRIAGRAISAFCGSTPFSSMTTCASSGCGAT